MMESHIWPDLPFETRGPLEAGSVAVGRRAAGARHGGCLVRTATIWRRGCDLWRSSIPVRRNAFREV